MLVKARSETVSRPDGRQSVKFLLRSFRVAGDPPATREDVQNDL
jgi:hypothetical protein